MSISLLCRIVVLVAFVLGGCHAALPQQVSNQAAIPDDLTIQKSNALVAEVYGAEIKAAKTPAQRSALAEKLIQIAANSRNDTASRFVLLKTAQDLASQAGDLELALRVVDQLAGSYKIDGRELRASIILKASKSAGRQTASVINSILTLADESIRADDLDTAQELVDVALRFARRLGDTELIRRAVACREKIAGILQEYAQAKASIEKLKQSPDDPSANLNAGKYLCFVKGEWEKGLPLLAKCGDAWIQDAAKLEIQGAKTAEQQAAIGDAWWDLAAKREGRDKADMQQRAAHWYAAAMPGLIGLPRELVKKRIETIQENQSREVVVFQPKWHSG